MGRVIMFLPHGIADPLGRSQHGLQRGVCTSNHTKRLNGDPHVLHVLDVVSLQILCACARCAPYGMPAYCVPANGLIDCLHAQVLVVFRA